MTGPRQQAEPAGSPGLPIRLVAASVFLLLALTTVPCRADTGRIGPSFACPRPAPIDGLSQMICDNPDMSREEMIFEQAYYALRQANGRPGWKALKVEAIAFNTALRTHCGIPLAGASDQTMPLGAAACYIDQTQRDRDAWLQRLTGAAHEEASRSIEQHVALQQRLVDLGYLPPGTRADGIYGETTRSAIQAWQEASGQHQTAGFLSDDDAAALSASTVRASAPVAPTGTDVPSTLHTNAIVFACINPRATRALGNKADPRQSSPGWVAFVRSDGRCFSVSPDQGWGADLRAGWAAAPAADAADGWRAAAVLHTRRHPAKDSGRSCTIHRACTACCAGSAGSATARAGCGVGDDPGQS